MVRLNIRDTHFRLVGQITAPLAAMRGEFVAFTTSRKEEVCVRLVWFEASPVFAERCLFANEMAIAKLRRVKGFAAVEREDDAKPIGQVGGIMAKMRDFVSPRAAEATEPAA